MRQEIATYVADKVMQDLRSNHALGEELSSSLNKFPLIDVLRNFVEEEDVLMLLELAATKDAEGDEFSLLISLLNKFSTRTDVRTFLLNQWHEHVEYAQRYALMWRILDDEELDLSVHREVYNFVTNHFERFEKDMIGWYGGTAQVLSGVRSRLSDPSFPKSKDWVYLCAAIGSSERDDVLELVGSYRGIPNDFVSEVANELMQKLERE